MHQDGLQDNIADYLSLTCKKTIKLVFYLSQTVGVTNAFMHREKDKTKNLKMFVDTLLLKRGVSILCLSIELSPLIFSRLS